MGIKKVEDKHMPKEDPLDKLKPPCCKEAAGCTLDVERQACALTEMPEKPQCCDGSAACATEFETKLCEAMAMMEDDQTTKPELPTCCIEGGCPTDEENKKCFDTLLDELKPDCCKDPNGCTTNMENEVCGMTNLPEKPDCCKTNECVGDEVQLCEMIKKVEDKLEEQKEEKQPEEPECCKMS